MISEDDIYLGIEFYPAVNKYRASTGFGRRAKVIGFFDTLDAAVTAAAKARDPFNRKGQDEQSK